MLSDNFRNDVVVALQSKSKLLSSLKSIAIVHNGQHKPLLVTLKKFDDVARLEKSLLILHETGFENLSDEVLTRDILGKYTIILCFFFSQISFSSKSVVLCKDSEKNEHKNEKLLPLTISMFKKIDMHNEDETPILKQITKVDVLSLTFDTKY